MPKNFLFLLALTVILVTGYFTLAMNALFSKVVSKVMIDTAVNQAKHTYRQEKEKGRDFSSGPCLSDALLPDWVVDLAHNPRIAMDDLPENQCPGFFEGRAHHFVELDLEGNLIRAQ